MPNDQSPSQPGRRRDLAEWLPHLRLAYGVSLLLGSSTPGARARASTGARRFAAVLGLRQTLEALVGERWRSRPLIIGAAAVDAVHALTVLALTARGSHRRAELANALVAAALCAAGLARARAAEPSHRWGT